MLFIPLSTAHATDCENTHLYTTTTRCEQEINYYCRSWPAMHYPAGKVFTGINAKTYEFYRPIVYAALKFTVAQIEISTCHIRRSFESSSSFICVSERNFVSIQIDPFFFTAHCVAFQLLFSSFALSLPPLHPLSPILILLRSRPCLTQALLQASSFQLRRRNPQTTDSFICCVTVTAFITIHHEDTCHAAPNQHVPTLCRDSHRDSAFASSPCPGSSSCTGVDRACELFAVSAACVNSRRVWETAAAVA
jgi:hypothetical protein